MSQKIDLDQRRFRKIIRGKIKDNLRKYISNGEMVARKGKDTVSIPLPSVDIPRFKHGGKQQGGVGQGDGEVGDSLGKDGEEQPGGPGEAGDKPGEHALEVDVSLEELAEILGEELALPRIEPKGSEKITSHKDRYTGIRTTGPESLKHFRRTYKEGRKTGRRTVWEALVATLEGSPAPMRFAKRLLQQPATETRRGTRF